MRPEPIPPFHQLDQLRQRLRDCGAKPCHEQRVFRAWLQARPLDSGARRHRPEDFLPLGIRTARMNGFTFAFGSGLAGLGGAFLSQLGNVGPSMGQSYIVDSFMIVTVGGVGNIIGASLSALGIGSVDQMLQPLLGPVMGKITTLLAVILLLQWRPGGIFPSRSRSLEG